MPQTNTAARRAPANRTPEEIAEAARQDEELMRQLQESLEEEKAGIPAMPFREVVEEARR
jgi:hypothetical protein